MSKQRTGRIGWLLTVMTGCAVAASRAAGGNTVTVINNADAPVYAMAISLPVGAVAQKTGLKDGIPLELVRTDGTVFPLIRHEADGKASLRSILSLKAGERMDFTMRPAKAAGASGAASSASFDPASKTAELSNGLLKLAVTGNTWSLAYASDDKAVVCRNNRMDYWLTDTRHGRFLGYSDQKLRDAGLLRSTEVATIAEGKAVVNPDGSATLTLFKRFPGIGENVRWEESYTLLAGEPVLIYKHRWTCTDEQTRYIAYVGIGGGLAGDYGSLLQGKLRFKYDTPASGSEETASGISVAETTPISSEGPRILLSGPNNSYTRISWRNERCWVGVDSELGNGLAISTLKDAFVRFIPGNTVWSFHNNGYETRLLDHEQENQPYEFSREKPLELGYAIAATCARVGIWNQGRYLFKAVTAGKTPSVGNACAVYLNGAVLTGGETPRFEFSAKQPASLVTDGNTLRAALETDFKRPYTLRAAVSGVTAQEPLTITATAGTGEVFTVLSFREPGEQIVDFTAATGWLKSRRNYTLEVSQGAKGRLESLVLEPGVFAGPQLDVPADGLAMTDVATYFRWNQVRGAIDYEIQLDRSESFGSPVTIKVRSEVVKPYYMPKDAELPAPGKWHWRLRAVEEGRPGLWSETRSFTVNQEYAKRPCVFNPAADHPYFTLEGCRVPNWERFKEIFPADIKPHVVINAPLHNEDDPIGYYRPLAEAGLPSLIRVNGPFAMSRWVPLSMVEELFQTYPELIGVSGGEALSAHYHGGDKQIYTERLLKLCAKYGRVFYDADGSYPGEFKYQALYEKKGAFMEEYKDYLIFAQKNNILHRQMVSQSAVLGLYLTGNILAQGAWEDGGWYWQQTGFKKLGEVMGQRGGDVTMMPRIFWTLNYVMGLGRGCTVFSFEGQVGTTPVPKGWKVAEKGLPEITDACYRNPAAFWTTDGEWLPTWNRFCLPFIRAVIDHQLVPSKADVLKNIRLAVYNDGVAKKESGDQYYYEWEDVYRGTYGFRDIGVHPGTLMEFFPNTGRYYYFPVLPQGKRDLGNGIEVLPLSQFGDVAKVKSVFDAAYPAWYSGDALVNLCGDTLTVLNSNENLDEVQSYSVPLKDRGNIRNVAGKIGPHAYVAGKFEDGNKRLWLQANTEYYERGDTTELTLTCAAAPVVTVTPASAAKVNRWDPAAKTLSLSLSHSDGAVEVEIQ